MMQQPISNIVATGLAIGGAFITLYYIGRDFLKDLRNTTFYKPPED